MAAFELNDLYAFGLIAEAGGISAAARQFGLSKATLSRALQRLERTAGAPLFDRTGRSMQLTPTGNGLLPAARQAVALQHDADETLRTQRGIPGGPLDIAVSALSGETLLAPVIADFVRRYPAVQAAIHVSSTGPDPMAAGLDMAIRVGRPKEPYLVARRIMASDLALYVHRRSAQGIDLDNPDAVQALGRIVVEGPDVPGRWQLSDTHGHDILMASPPLVTVSDPSVALGILAAGSGLVFLPRVFADPLVRDGTLQRALPGFSGPAIELFAVLPPRRSNVPAVRAFLDMLVAHAAASTEVADPLHAGA